MRHKRRPRGLDLGVLQVSGTNKQERKVQNSKVLRGNLRRPREQRLLELGERDNL